MKQKHEMSGGVACRDGFLYVLTNSGSADEDDRTVWSGVLNGGRVIFKERAQVADLVSIVSLSGSLGTLGQAMAMTGEGEVFIFSEGDTVRGQIPGAGYTHAGAKKAGRMTVLKQVGDELFALGYGGQAYRFDVGIGWIDLGFPSESQGQETGVTFFTAARLDSTLCFAGTRTHKFKRTPEFIRASSEGDSPLRARLMLQARVPDIVALWLYDGRWRDMELDHPGVIVEIVPSIGVPKHFFTTKGAIIVSPQLEEFGAVFTFSGRKSFWDIKEVKGRPLLLFDGSLSEWDGSMLDLSPQIPPADQRYLNVSVFDNHLFAFEESAILSMGLVEWINIDYDFE